MPPAASVLIVEEHEAVRSALARILIDEDYRVRAAPGAAEAIDVIRRGDVPIDVAIVNVVLPAPGGLAVVEALRERMSPLRVILISGYDPITLRRFPGLEPLVELDGFRLLSKPFDARELTATLEDLMRTSADRVHLVTGEWAIPRQRGGPKA